MQAGSAVVTFKHMDIDTHLFSFAAVVVMPIQILFLQVVIEQQ